MVTGLPAKVGPYEPVAELATGGMARVLVAKQTGMAGFERQVALKLMRPELADDHDYANMFLDEARIAARIQHPNVVTVLDVGRDDRTQILYIAMELVLGATVSQMVRTRRPIPTNVAIELVAQAADGLDAAHRATTPSGAPLELVHRDVSPANLLVGFDGVVRVSDFGIARAAERMTKTTAGQFKGKLEYCAPEQALGHSVDRRTDLFGLGIVAWELFSGDRLFEGPTPFKTLDAVLNLEIPPVSRMRTGIPDEVAEMIHAMLQRDVSRRPSRAAQVAEVFRRAAASAALEPPHQPLRDWARMAANPSALRLAGLPTDEDTLDESLDGERQTLVSEPPPGMDEEPVTRVTRPGKG
ncbi:MAG: serine/threonine-protein kinase [Sandaracinaceae bacterium]